MPSTGMKNPQSGKYVPDNGATPIFLSKGERFPPANRQAANYHRRREGMGPLTTMLVAPVVAAVMDVAVRKAHEHIDVGDVKMRVGKQARRVRRSLYVARKEWKEGA